MKTYAVTYARVVDVEDTSGIPDAVRETFGNLGYEPDTITLLEDDDEPLEPASDDSSGAVVETPYYEVQIRLPLGRYSERWFDQVADAAGDHAAVSGSVVPFAAS